MSYSISEVAEMMGVTPSTLRYYDKEGLLPDVRRMNGIRVFEESDFGWLRILNCLKNTGMPIKRIREYVELTKQGDATLEQRYQLILEQRQYVQDQIDQLQYFMQELDYKDWYYRTAIAAGTERAVQCHAPKADLEPDRIPQTGKPEVNILQELFALQEKSYGDFQYRLTPGIDREKFIGVRVPLLRKLAKQLKKENKAAGFLRTIPHTYYEENMLHGLLISEIMDPQECIRELDAFLPYVDNWAVCDVISPRIFKKMLKSCPEVLLQKIREWSASPETYTCRFGLEMLMNLFLEESFQPEYLEIPAAIRSDAYYVKMMQAWFFATALAKQWESTIPYLEKKDEGEGMEIWVHNKTIQKACESYRITAEQKEYLRTLRRKEQ